MNKFNPTDQFDPEPIIALVKESGGDPKLIDALSRCKRGRWENDAKAYIHFKSPSEWAFKRNVVLKDLVEGTIVIDILEGDQVGGIEFVDRINL
jgi:hypothetical protein